MILVAIIVLSYLIGSIPFSIIVSKAVQGIDIREHGSGNAGGTNVFRTLGWKWGLLVILLDALKGVFVVLVVTRLFFLAEIQFVNIFNTFEDFTVVQIIAGLSAIAGHVWSVFAGFKGGKGIATALGILITIATIDMLFAVAVFIIVVAISKYVSLGSIIGAVTVPSVMIIRENFFHADIQGYNTMLPFLVGLVVFVIFTHRKNIQRLWTGRESKILFSRKDKGK